MTNTKFSINTTSLLSLNFIIWGLVTFLYSLQLSSLLGKVDVFKVYMIGLSIPFVFLLGFTFAYFVFNKNGKIKVMKLVNIDVDKLIKKTKTLTYIFIVLVIFEIIYSGYIPLFSMLSSDSISQFNFGIKSLHGMVMSFGALLFTTWFFIFYITKSKTALLWSIFILLLFALMVTRKMMIVSILQAAILIFYLRHDNKVIIKFSLYGILTLVIFGIIGDIRTGREIFLSLSHFTVDYPEWLPTGFGWIYIYITTPIANLVSAIDMTTYFSYDFSFTKGLLPSFIRVVFFDVDDNAFDNEWQISGAFNIATGFIGIYKSFGYIGIFLFNFILGFIYKILIIKTNNLVFFLITVIFTNITLLLLFSNNFFNLNTISQIIFVYLLFGISIKLKKRNTLEKNICNYPNL